MEKWTPIPDYDNYEINNTGEIRNINTDHVLHNGDRKGYKSVTLFRNGVRSTEMVHRLVAKTFIDNPDGKNEVNHIDGDKLNNSVENLEWCDRSENMKHAFANDLKKPSGGLTARAVEIIETGERFPSTYDCARVILGDQGHINACANGKRKTHKGYHFRYVDERG